LITFLSKAKYTISNAIVIVTYEISYNCIEIVTLKLVEVNYIEY